MFSIQCPVHGGEVLLGERRVTGVENSGGRITVRWTCWCGHRGSHVTGRGNPSVNII